MRKVREVLRLHHVAGLSGRAIARSLKISPVTVRRYVSRTEELGLGWPLPESLDDAELERRLFPPPAPSCSPRPLAEWTEVHRELRGKDVTLALAWEEYKAAHPQGLQYSRFCERYRAGIDVSERLIHLSTFLGHVDPESTAWYLTITAELLEQANQRFERYASPALEVCVP